MELHGTEGEANVNRVEVSVYVCVGGKFSVSPSVPVSPFVKCD